MRKPSRGATALFPLVGCVCWVVVFRFLLLEHAAARAPLPASEAPLGRELRPAHPRCAETVHLEDGTRSFVLWAPEPCDGDDSNAVDALLVLVHGFTGRPQMWGSVAARATARGWLVAAPYGAQASWNAGPCCGAARDTGLDDVAFLRAMIAAIRARRNFRRVFGAGFSNGGFLVTEVAGGRLGGVPLFDAVAPWGGHAYELRRNATPIPIFMNHGERDGVVKIGG